MNVHHKVEINTQAQTYHVLEQMVAIGESMSSSESVNNLITTPALAEKGRKNQGIMKTGGTSLFQWPKLTVSSLLGSSEMDTVVTYYRILNLANNVNDEEQHHKEKVGLSEDVIRRHLRTRIRDSSSTSLNELGATGENSDTCSICKAEFKDPDIIASLYYCPHDYHADCIFGCLLNSKHLPLMPGSCNNFRPIP